MERHSWSGDAARRRLGRVLVVEDERDVAELIRYHLSKDGYEIQLAFDGAGVGDLEIDRRRFQVTMRGRPVDLTRKEFELLVTLASEPGREKLFAVEEFRDGAGSLQKTPTTEATTEGERE
jgi:CheY-like chemotaxis protein